MRQKIVYCRGKPFREFTSKKYFGSSMGHKPVKATRYTNPGEVLPPPATKK